MAAPTIVIVRQGMPFDTPVINGHTFYPLHQDDLWLALVTEEEAAHMTRVPNYSRFGGKVPDGFFGGHTAPPQATTGDAGDAGAKEPGKAPKDDDKKDPADPKLDPEIADLTRKQLAEFALARFKQQIELGKLDDMRVAVQALIDGAKASKE